VPADTVQSDPHPDLRRARDDYLAVSRGAHMYASPRDHDVAEQRAWERLLRALRAAGRDPGGGPG
jgi:hypothetical protein